RDAGVHQRPEVERAYGRRPVQGRFDSLGRAHMTEAQSRGQQQDPATAGIVTVPIAEYAAEDMPRGGVRRSRSFQTHEGHVPIRDGRAVNVPFAVAVPGIVRQPLELSQLTDVLQTPAFALLLLRRQR